MFRPAAAVSAALVRVSCLWFGLCAAQTSEQLNYRPIVGVLAQEIRESDLTPNGSTYIPASYVKFLEGGGARVVPIRIYDTEENYAKTFNSINGLVLPGGDVDLTKSKSTRVARIFYDLAIKANDAGDYFPIWGACQGFQQLSYLTANKDLLTFTNTTSKALPLTFTPGYRYPFYAVQWHPEKSAYEWIDKPGMVHSTAGLRSNFYAARFFVSEAMKSHHQYPSLDEEQDALIYNFTPVFKGLKAIFIQNYYFD
ncbi:hypothetical protein Q5P01_001141 [Channa striata]|uniref:folate gamma-glutamyl hydrolase n=1 Tax=Channa striata TaxID=64152 RepID=A0AA88NYB6_CHASR|nr:hypothetical protein Q5P01_001141 [Channa striata]